MHLPERMLKATFAYRGYIVPLAEQQSLTPVVFATLQSLTPLQQQVLIQYYSNRTSLRSLSPALGISFGKLNREFHLATHQLRLAANRPYREAHEKITG